MREERLVTRNVLEMGGPTGESGAKPLKGGGYVVTGPVRFFVYPYRFTIVIDLVAGK